MESQQLVDIGFIISDCSEPLDAENNQGCYGNSYFECVAWFKSFCPMECPDQPAGECYTSCVLKAQTDCDLNCSSIYDCDSCKEVWLRQQNFNEDMAEDICSTEGKLCADIIHHLPFSALFVF